MGTWTAFAHLAGAASLAVCACAGEESGRRYVAAGFLERAYRDREPFAATVEAPPPLVAEYALPDSVVRFRLEKPSAIAAVGPPRCEVAIADVGDQAVHLFSTDGSYRRTLYAQRLPRPFSSVASMAADAERLWIGYLSRPYFTLVSGVGDAEYQIPRPPVVEGLLPRVHLAAGPNGTVLEHWFWRGYHLDSDSWHPDLPLVRWFGSSGNVLSQGGRLAQYRGKTFTAALNSGFVAYARDTVWFARAADATVLAAPLVRMSAAWAAVVRLPVAYKVRRPYETASSVGMVTHVLGHLTTFAVAPTGTVFVFGQVLAWGDRPTTALGVYHRASGRYQAFGLGGQIYEVRMPTTTLAVVVHRDTTMQRTVVRAYRLPTSASEGLSDPELMCPGEPSGPLQRSSHDGAKSRVEDATS